MLITTEQIMALRPCWSRDRVADLVGEGIDPGRDLAVETLRSIARPDARWLLARLLRCEQRILWAQACAQRAKEYTAAAADAAYAAAAAASAAAAAVRAAAAADAADAAAAYTADAAVDAYAAADAADARAAYAAVDAYAARAAADAEHMIAVRHALALLAGTI